MTDTNDLAAKVREILYSVVWDEAGYDTAQTQLLALIEQHTQQDVTDALQWRMHRNLLERMGEDIKQYQEKIAELEQQRDQDRDYINELKQLLAKERARIYQLEQQLNASQHDQ